MRNLVLVFGLCFLILIGCSRPVPADPAVSQPPRVEAPSPPVIEPAPAPPPKVQVPAAPPSYKVAFYRPTDMVAGNSQPRRSFEMEGEINALALAPDAETLLRYPADPFLPASPPAALYHLPTGKSTPLPLPADTHFLAHFLPDGRLVVIGGGQIRLGAPPELKPIAEGGARSSWLSPSGKLLALWGNRAVRILDLATGKTVQVEGTYRPLGQDGGIMLTWAPDSTRLTATDTAMPHEQPQPSLNRMLTTTYVIDARSGKRIREHKDLRVDEWLADGTWLGGIGPVTHEGPPTLHLTSEGKEIRELPRFSYRASPDGKYALSDEGLVEIATGKSYKLPTGGWRLWAHSGELVIFTRQPEG